jgi:light-regulated signal transduction histidine kinase (bacteriophytochrome)
MTPAERIPQFADPHGSAGSRVPRRDAHHSQRSAAMLERDIKTLSARVEQLEREKAAVEAFAAVAAHELVEPLVMTEAYATIVSDRLDADQHADSRRDLDALSRGAARMRLLIETLLHDARSSGRDVKREPVELHRIVTECLALLAPEIAARGADVKIEPLPNVEGEEALLSGLFANLLINALKYSPRQSPTIRVRALREAQEWRFEVQSSGPTIPVEDRERIFEPFHRGTGERRARGAGLGLTTCKRIVERHGGAIGVRAANGSGNVFHFTLPA